MKKVVFLDIDGVLNSTRTLYEDISLEDDLILNLKELVNKTWAKIVLSSSWRLFTEAIATRMDKLDKFGLVVSGMTCDGVDLDWIESFEFNATKKYLDTRFDCDENKQIKITHDRGVEIFKWLSEHKEVESFVILDDEDWKYNHKYIEGFVFTDQTGFMTKAKTAYYNFWKYMRSVADQTLRQGYIRSTDSLTSVEANLFYGFCHDLFRTDRDAETREYPYKTDIITLREKYYNSSK